MAEKDWNWSLFQEGSSNGNSMESLNEPHFSSILHKIWPEITRFQEDFSQVPQPISWMGNRKVEIRFTPVENCYKIVCSRFPVKMFLEFEVKGFHGDARYFTKSSRNTQSCWRLMPAGNNNWRANYEQFPESLNLMRTRCGRSNLARQCSYG